MKRLGWLAVSLWLAGGVARAEGEPWTPEQLGVYLNVVPPGAPSYSSLEQATEYIYVRSTDPIGWVCVARFPTGALATYGAVGTPGNWDHFPPESFASPLNDSGGSELFPSYQGLLWDVAHGAPPVHGWEPAVVARRILVAGMFQDITLEMEQQPPPGGWGGERDERTERAWFGGGTGEGSGQSR